MYGTNRPSPEILALGTNDTAALGSIVRDYVRLSSCPPSDDHAASMVPALGYSQVPLRAKTWVTTNRLRRVTSCRQRAKSKKQRRQ
jgi:hypothetical protein